MNGCPERAAIHRMADRLGGGPNIRSQEDRSPVQVGTRMDIGITIPESGAEDALVGCLTAGARSITTAKLSLEESRLELLL
jgi:hypothetical protein